MSVSVGVAPCCHGRSSAVGEEAGVLGDVGDYGVDCGRRIREGTGGGEGLERGRDEGSSEGLDAKFVRLTRSVGRRGDAEGFHGSWPRRIGGF